jgi:hypothetical protein
MMYIGNMRMIMSDRIMSVWMRMVFWQGIIMCMLMVCVVRMQMVVR